MDSDPKADLRAHWLDFCDADPFEGADTFADRMEAAGLIALVPVTDDALEDPFAYERGIEPGGTMYVLTSEGNAAIALVDEAQSKAAGK